LNKIFSKVTITKTFLNLLPTPAILKRYIGGKGTIFMMHQVASIDKNGLPSVEKLKITPEYLENSIKQLKKLNYDFISITNLEERLKNDSKKRFAIFTLDDGYRDNYINAYKIFKKYNIPFTIYVTSSFPNKSAILWWYCVAELIMKKDKIITSKHVISTNNIKEKERAFRVLKEEILSFDYKNLEDELIKYLSRYNIKECLDGYREKLCISWDELKELSKDSLVTIGGHTKSHPSLVRLSLKDAINEILENKKELENKLNIEINTFAYPFGSDDDFTKREEDLVESLGFKNALTTKIGNIFSIHQNNLYALPRVALTEGLDIDKKLYIVPFIKNRAKRV